MIDLVIMGLDNMTASNLYNAKPLGKSEECEVMASKKMLGFHCDKFNEGIVVIIQYNTKNNACPHAIGIK
jgi:hypothetical protein